MLLVRKIINTFNRFKVTFLSGCVEQFLQEPFLFKLRGLPQWEKWYSGLAYADNYSDNVMPHHTSKRNIFMGSRVVLLKVSSCDWLSAHCFFVCFLLYQSFLSQILTIHRAAGVSRGPSLIPLYHFRPLTNIQTCERTTMHF